MRENFTYGSVRGAAGNGGPYRDRRYAKSGWNSVSSQCQQFPFLGRGDL